MKKNRYCEARRKATERYRHSHAEQVRKKDTELKRKNRMRQKLLKTREDVMTDKFEEMKPVLFRWATFFATWDRYFEIHELVNVAFADGGLRRVKDPKMLSKKAKWLMQKYMRDVRRENPVDKIIRDYVKKYGRLTGDYHDGA